jgi:DNA repair protein RecO (recombination protein O)
MSSAELQPAYVLHTRRFAENSLLVELLTRDCGRMTVFAKGALNSRSGRQGLLQPFTPLMAVWRGRGETPSLHRVEPAGPAHWLKYKRLYCGLYLNELLLHLLGRQEPQLAIFAHYTAALSALLESTDQHAALELVLRQFECRLLEELGIGLHLTHDHAGQPLNAETYYQYRIEDGPCPCETHHPLGIQGATFLALASEAVLSGQQRKEARRLLRHVLDYYLQGRPLKSRSLFR